MARNDNENYILGQAISILQSKTLEDLTPEERGQLSAALKFYVAYCEAATGHEPDHRIEDVSDLFQINILPDLGAILGWKPEEKEEEEEPKKAPEPKKEEAAVPAELETLVATYKEAQANKLEEDTSHSVADAVKRARQAWSNRHQAELIRENRLKKIEDASERQKQRDTEDEAREDFIIQTVNPKAESTREIYEELTLAVGEAIRTQNPNLTKKQVDAAVNNALYLTLSGAIDIQNTQDFYIATQLAIKEAGVSIGKDLDQLDELEKDRLAVLNVDPYSNRPDEIQNEINLADEAVSQKIQDASLGFSEEIQKRFKDYDVHFPEAVRQNTRIQNAYVNAIPQAKLPGETKPTPLQLKAASLEADIRKADPNLLKINVDAGAAKVIGLLQVTQSGNRNISPEAVKLLSLGLTAEKLDQARDNPNSVLGKLYHSEKYGDVFKQVHFQIRRIQNSEAGKDINGTRPVSGIDKYFNKLSPAAQSATKLILDPRGTIISWTNREMGKRIGQRLIEASGSAFAQKLGGFLVTEGFQQGVKTFAREAALKVAVKVTTWAALKLGVSLTAESLNAIMPGLGLIVDIAAQILLWLGEKTIGYVWNQFQKLHNDIYGHDFSFKEASIPIIAGGVAFAGIAATSIAAFIVFRRTAQIAIVSAFGIIVTSIAIIVFYVSFSYLVAPILSTLVQLDSVEKVEYEDYVPLGPTASDCGWPTKGKYQVQSGPEGATHARSKLQAIDIFGGGATTINGTPQISATDGTVFSAGSYLNYGNTVIIQTSNSAGSFKVAYGHMGSMKATPGQKVKQGDVIGTVGFTALFPNPHIHWEVIGIKYNQCPAGGVKMPVGCFDFPSCGSVFTN